MDHKKAIVDALAFMKTLPKKYAYHNYNHAMFVIQMVEILGKAEHLNAEELILLRTAAAYHDIGYHFQYEYNEPQGAAYAVKKLGTYGYSDQEIEQVKSLILVTAIPQQPKNKREEVMCDADMAHLGSQGYAAKGETLRQEINACTESKLSMRKWYEEDIVFFEEHHYYTASAKRLLGPQKDKNLAEIKDALQRDSA